MSHEVLLDVKSVSKAFSGVTVLNNVSVGIRKGEILGLIGENGAGKSTLIKVINGIHAPSGGGLILDGEEIEVRDAAVAKKLGIAMVPQEFNLIETLNVYENIFLGSEIRRKGGFLDRQAMRRKSRELLDRLETSISVESRISDLSVAEKQMVEISKALIHDAKILIFDEPTTALTQHEIDILFDLMNRLRDDGVTMVFVSHKLKEVKQLCDRVMVLRDGNFISIDNIDDIDEHQMAQSMVGRELSQIFPPKPTDRSEETVLSVEGLVVPGKVKDVSISLKKGEILGLSGLVGAGRTELAEAIMGLRPKTKGRIFIKGQEVVVDNPGVALSHNLAYISEDRQGRGIHLIFDIVKNTTLISLRNFQKFFINKKKAIEKTRKYVDLFNIKAPSMEIALENLSGGNQQKVYLSKWMDTDPEILILDEPTRGIDINAKSEIYQLIHKLAEEGISIIVISSELEEIIGLCSRTYVLREGTLTGELHGEEINEEEIMFHATGVKKMENIA